MMKNKSPFYNTIISGLILWSFLFNSMPVYAQKGEIVSSDDISGGSSVFVFRQSRKTPQAKFTARPIAKRPAPPKPPSRSNVRDQVAKVIPQRDRSKKVDPNAPPVAKPPKNGGDTPIGTMTRE